VESVARTSLLVATEQPEQFLLKSLPRPSI
jgi:hypothetical protein